MFPNVQTLFKSSSEFLHKATNGRVYFKKVTIELPYTWPKRTSAQPVSESLFEKSDVRVDVPIKARGDRPFTKQVKECGEAGDFIHLTPGFLAQTKNPSASATLPPGKLEFLALGGF
ncbi:hypothetical protein HPB48_022774 [Haemaphysalis longicornis]|uniref:Calcium-activated chloride channel N-terminal domain-containing protein n=1 Tax=Haemaphysalis longicornis TaxID=44386 RepID=A0A9J6FNX9_HAELO|nr:hypothetical protein HPB48_022774 [Haemaphysalis longicornis]